MACRSRKIFPEEMSKFILFKNALYNRKIRKHFRTFKSSKLKTLTGLA